MPSVHEIKKMSGEELARLFDKEIIYVKDANGYSHVRTSRTSIGKLSNILKDINDRPIRSWALYSPFDEGIQSLTPLDDRRSILLYAVRGGIHISRFKDPDMPTGDDFSYADYGAFDSLVGLTTPTGEEELSERQKAILQRYNMIQQP